MTLYHQTGFVSVETTSSNYLGDWEREISEVTKKGKGFEISGELVAVHNHNLTETSKKKVHRYVCFILQVNKVRRREWENGEEIDTDRVQKTVARTTGYLNKTEKIAIHDPYSVEVNELANLIAGGKGLPQNYHPQQLNKLHPKVSAHFEFWADSQLLKGSTANVGDVIRLKTKGDSIFVETLSSSPSPASRSLPTLTTGTNYSGEDVLSGWTGKIQQRKEQTTAENDDDDEWK
eukprot:TRINITY_DN2019_c0_g1_i1.p1 TRINITY_DN2019_c0_g1~~TRINITY_DN2019_c0_g1_i1.p1  ORF type:complete len:234 (-),score=60.73 TRINITY_DN2019_c0_g1_i1:18-719(-)